MLFNRAEFLVQKQNSKRTIKLMAHDLGKPRKIIKHCKVDRATEG